MLCLVSICRAAIGCKLGGEAWKFLMSNIFEWKLLLDLHEPKSSMLCPNTARPDRSIWDTVSRKTFETNVDALSQAKIAPGPRILTRNDWPEQRQKDRLGFGISLQLSDDFAFISACDYGVGYVTVAAIEQARNGEYTLRLAANEGICASVKTALLELLDVLRNCATKGNTLPAFVSLEDCTNVCRTVARSML